MSAYPPCRCDKPVPNFVGVVNFCRTCGGQVPWPVGRKFKPVPDKPVTTIARSTDREGDAPSKEGP